MFSKVTFIFFATHFFCNYLVALLTCGVWLPVLPVAVRHCFVCLFVSSLFRAILNTYKIVNCRIVVFELNQSVKVAHKVLRQDFSSLKLSSGPSFSTSASLSVKMPMSKRTLTFKIHACLSNSTSVSDGAYEVKRGNDATNVLSSNVK